MELFLGDPVWVRLAVPFGTALTGPLQTKGLTVLISKLSQSHVSAASRSSKLLFTLGV